MSDYKLFYMTCKNKVEANKIAYAEIDLNFYYIYHFLLSLLVFQPQGILLIHA